MSEAASSTAQALRDADVHEFASNTTGLIRSARPFFLAIFALLFTALGFLKGNSAASVLFIFGAIVFVLGAAFSEQLDHIFGGRSSRPTETPRKTDGK